MIKQKEYDVIVVGGSYAGLSAAMSLGRSLRSVLLVDNGKPCNAPTPHSHNFLTQDGKTPSEIAMIAKSQVELYDTIQLEHDLAVSAQKSDYGFEMTLQSGSKAHGKKLVFATGIKDELPDIPGFSDCWGKSVIHCPYCHGYEYRGKNTAIFGNGDAAIHYALLISNLTRQLTIFTNGSPTFSQEQLVKLESHRITINETEVVEIEHNSGQLRSIILKNGKSVPFDAMYFKAPFRQHCSIPELLGCEINENGYVKIDPTQKTTVEGVFACGDNSSAMRSVASAVAAGNFAGAVVNKELALERF